MPWTQEKSVMQGWRAAALTPAGNVSALCQASTPGPSTTLLGNASISFPHLHSTPQFGDILENSDHVLLSAPFGSSSPKNLSLDNEI